MMDTSGAFAAIIALPGHRSARLSRCPGPWTPGWPAFGTARVAPSREHPPSLSRLRSVAGPKATPRRVAGYPASPRAGSASYEPAFAQARRGWDRWLGCSTRVRVRSNGLLRPTGRFVPSRHSLPTTPIYGLPLRCKRVLIELLLNVVGQWSTCFGTHLTESRVVPLHPLVEHRLLWSMLCITWWLNE